MTQYTIERSDTDKVIEVAPGDMVAISLPENATTGYRWTVDLFDGQAVELQESSSVAQEPEDVGRGSSRTFLFRAQIPGVVSVQFLLRRSWEPQGSAVDQFTMIIHIQPYKASGSRKVGAEK